MKKRLNFVLTIVTLLTLFLIVGCQPSEESLDVPSELGGDAALAGQATGSVYDQAKLQKCQTIGSDCWTAFMGCYQSTCGSSPTGSTAWGQCVNTCLDSALGLITQTGVGSGKRIYTKPPDMTALKNLLDQVIGRAKESVEHSGTMTLEDLYRKASEDNNEEENENMGFKGGDTKDI